MTETKYRIIIRTKDRCLVSSEATKEEIEAFQYSLKHENMKGFDFFLFDGRTVRVPAAIFKSVPIEYVESGKIISDYDRMEWLNKNHKIMRRILKEKYNDYRTKIDSHIMADEIWRTN